MNRYPSRVLAAAVLLLSLVVANAVLAHDYQFKSLHIDHPFARATPPGATSGGVFLSIDNAGPAADTLVSAASPAAGAVQIHTMSMDNGVMRMREIPGLDIPAGGSVALKPGSYHLMLLDLKHPLAPGDKVPLRLTFAHAGSIDVEVHVEDMAAMAPMSGMAPMGGMGDHAKP
jgi:copper(I)-binding protein